VEIVQVSKFSIRIHTAGRSSEIDEELILPYHRIAIAFTYTATEVASSEKDNIASEEFKQALISCPALNVTDDEFDQLYRRFLCFEVHII
jgi:hypothetical protein